MKFVDYVNLFFKDKDDSEFLLAPLPRWANSITLTLISLTSFGIIFAFITKIDEVVITRGDLESNIPIQDIYPPNGGFVSDVLVKEGELVEIDQTLIILDSDLNLKTKNILQDQINNESERYLAELSILELKKESFLETQKNQEYIIAKFEKALDQGAITELDVIEKKEDYFNTNNKLLQIDSEIIKITKNSQKIINDYKKDLENIIKNLEYKYVKSSIRGIN